MNKGFGAPKGERWGSPHAVQTCLLGVEGAHLFDALLQDFFIDKHTQESNVFIMLSSNINSVNKKNSRLIPVRNQTGVLYAPENRQLTVDK